MARQPWQPSDDELARGLTELGERIAYPPAPDLAASIRARLAQTGPIADASSSSMPATRAHVAPDRRPRAPWLAGLRRRVALSIVAIALLLGGVLAVSPDARRAVAQWLGPRGVVILPLPRRLPAPVGAGLHLGRRVTLREARARLPFHVLLPTGPLSDPDEVYVRAVAGGARGHDDMVALVYRARPGLPRAHNTGVGLLLTETRGNALGGKFIGPDTSLEFVTIGGGQNGLPGYWLTGKPHLFAYIDAAGAFRWDTLRLAGDVLLWNRDRLVLRLESALSKDAAVRIASSMR